MIELGTFLLLIEKHVSNAAWARDVSAIGRINRRMNHNRGRADDEVLARVADEPRETTQPKSASSSAA